MCAIGPDVAALVAQVQLIANAEFALEESLRDTSAYQKALALATLERRKDERSASILRDYLRPVETAPLGLDDGRADRSTAATPMLRELLPVEAGG